MTTLNEKAAAMMGGPTHQGSGRWGVNRPVWNFTGDLNDAAALWEKVGEEVKTRVIARACAQQHDIPAGRYIADLFTNPARLTAAIVAAKEAVDEGRN